MARAIRRESESIKKQETRESKMRKIKTWLYNNLSDSLASQKERRAFDLFLVLLITSNVLAVILETEKDFYVRFGAAFRAFELFSVSLFTIEYVLRLWTCTCNPEFKGAVAGRLKYAVTPLALVDLIAILPFYLPMLMPFDMRILRVIRLVRLARLLKVGRYSETMKLFGRVLSAKRSELLATLFTLFILLIFSSGLLFYVENPAQPEKFSSISASVWWGAITLTTVGYGDIYPITPLGRFLGALISLLGIAFFAIPAGLLSSGFIEEHKKKRKEKQRCPKCGEPLDF